MSKFLSISELTKEQIDFIFKTNNERLLEALKVKPVKCEELFQLLRLTFVDFNLLAVSDSEAEAIVHQIFKDVENKYGLNNDFRVKLITYLFFKNNISLSKFHKDSIVLLNNLLSSDDQGGLLLFACKVQKVELLKDVLNFYKALTPSDSKNRHLNQAINFLIRSDTFISTQMLKEISKINQGYFKINQGSEIETFGIIKSQNEIKFLDVYLTDFLLNSVSDEKQLNSLKVNIERSLSLEVIRNTEDFCMKDKDDYLFFLESERVNNLFREFKIKTFKK